TDRSAARKGRARCRARSRPRGAPAATGRPAPRRSARPPGRPRRPRPAAEIGGVAISWSAPVYAPLERDAFSSNRHLVPVYWWRMILSENRYPLFGIMRYRTAAFTDAAVWPNRIARSSAVRMPPAFGLTSLALA